MKLNSPQINLITRACIKASRSLIRDFGEIEKLQVSKKGPNDFVTNADLKTEKTIINELKKARPNYSIISEEKGTEQNNDMNNTWIIDPIDGTINFLHGVPQLAISFICITIGSRTVESATVGILMLMETLCAPLWVWIFLNEVPPISVFLGGAVIILAIILKSFDKSKLKT